MTYGLGSSNEVYNRLLMRKKSYSPYLEFCTSISVDHGIFSLSVQKDRKSYYSNPGPRTTIIP